MKANDSLWGHCTADQWLADTTGLHRTSHDYLFYIAQGRPECSLCPVCSCATCYAQAARETAGAASTRSSLRPLKKRAESCKQTSDAMRRENVTSYSVVVTRAGG